MRSNHQPSARLALLLGACVCLLGTAGCDNAADGSASPSLIRGMPVCDESLLHPRISVQTTQSLPGKAIVYVDGIMACVDDAAKVDQIISRVEGRR